MIEYKQADIKRNNILYRSKISLPEVRRNNMKSLKGTKTEKNLLEAFAGESMARNKYTWFGIVARKAGYDQIAELFEKTANNEKAHAYMWFKELDQLGDTAANLLAAAEGENHEWTDMYVKWHKKLRKKVSLKSQQKCAVLQLSKNVMKNAIVNSYKTSKK